MLLLASVLRSGRAGPPCHLNPLVLACSFAQIVDPFVARRTMVRSSRPVGLSAQLSLRRFLHPPFIHLSSIATSSVPPFWVDSRGGGWRCACRQHAPAPPPTLLFSLPPSLRFSLPPPPPPLRGWPPQHNATAPVPSLPSRPPTSDGGHDQVMSFVDGFKVDDLAELDVAGADRDAIVGNVTRAYAQQIFCDGLFSAGSAPSHHHHHHPVQNGRTSLPAPYKSDANLSTCPSRASVKRRTPNQALSAHSATLLDGE
jgi:hypothetical protein